jgi:O-antigen/teichoic acid export membrane protein
MALADRLSRGVKALFGADIVDKLANGLLIVVLTRFLFTPEEYGQLNFVLAALGVVTILATLGLPKSAARYVTEFSETAPGQVPYVLRRSLVSLVGLVAVVVAGVVVVGEPVARLAGTPSIVPFLLVGGCYVGAQAFAKYFSALFQGFNRVDGTALLSVVTGVGRLVFVAGFVALGFGVGGALAGYVVASLLAAGIGGVVIYRRFYAPHEVAEEADADLTKRLLEYSVPLTATRGANVLDKKVDALLVGVLMNVTAVGYYAIAKQVSDFVASPAAAFGFTISPAIGEQKSSDHADRAATLYRRSLEFVLLLYVPGVAGLILVADPMVRHVFGPDYLRAVPVVQVFSGFILMNAINKVTSDGLDYLGRARSRAVIKTAMAVANFLLNLALIPVFGVVGAAAASVVTYTVYTLSNVYFIDQELDVDFGSVGRTLGIVSLITAAMSAVVFVALPYVSGIVTLLGAVGVGVAVWGTLAVLSGALDVREAADFLA